MRFSLFTATAALAGSALAADHLVVVGNGTLTFEPSNFTAAKDDTVTFKFWPKSHSVAQAAFASPCEPMEGGFWSGFIPSEKGAAAMTYMITITNESQPLWFYCSRGNHCQEGMVGVINPPPVSGGKTIEAFAKAAANASNNTSPTTTAGVGGMLMNGTTMNGTTNNSGASMLGASNGAIFTAALGMIAFLAL
ncbi:hypothetical protein N0V90_006049 [Kalmusia sp. IMI 367209]|nr:hypothetical protein N0V90_006049 [Kalmusia sp. IMI 367209]